VALVAAGVVAKKTIPLIKIEARILEIGGQTDYQALLQQAINEQDSLGGIIECRVSGLEIGLGEPFFDSVESTISHLMFSIPGIKGIEFGDGFKAAQMRGSEFNDAIIDAHGRTATNHSGGINGGISNGTDILFRVVTRPTASIGLVQNSFNFETNKMEGHQIVGRHDACIALRVPVIVEALTAVALADFNLMRRTQ
jgi:chorismate synthase